MMNHLKSKYAQSPHRILLCASTRLRRVRVTRGAPTCGKQSACCAADAHWLRLSQARHRWQGAKWLPPLLAQPA